MITKIPANLFLVFYLASFSNSVHAYVPNDVFDAILFFVIPLLIGILYLGFRLTKLLLVCAGSTNFQEIIAWLLVISTIPLLLSLSIYLANILLIESSAVPIVFGCVLVVLPLLVALGTGMLGFKLFKASSKED